MASKREQAEGAAGEGKEADALTAGRVEKAKKHQLEQSGQKEDAHQEEAEELDDDGLLAALIDDVVLEEAGSLCLLL